MKSKTKSKKNICKKYARIGLINFLSSSSPSLFMNDDSNANSDIDSDSNIDIHHDNNGDAIGTTSSIYIPASGSTSTCTQTMSTFSTLLHQWIQKRNIDNIATVYAISSSINNDNVDALCTGECDDECVAIGYDKRIDDND